MVELFKEYRWENTWPGTFSLEKGHFMVQRGIREDGRNCWVAWDSHASNCLGSFDGLMEAMGLVEWVKGATE